MKSNLSSPAKNPWPKLKPEEALTKPGFYFVVSSIMPEVGIIETGTTAKPVCVMLVANGKLFICNPSQEVTPDELLGGLTFQGPILPDKE